MKLSQHALTACLFLLVAACSSDKPGAGETTPDDASEDDQSDDAAGDDAAGDDAAGNDDGAADDSATTSVNTNVPDMETLVDPDEILVDDEVEGDPQSPGFGMLGEGCEWISEVPERLRSPVDIVFVIDNSSSMGGEIEQVQERINEDFARIIAQSGVDYRVIMIARYGDVDEAVGESDHPICVRAPLGAHDCSNPSQQPIAHNPPHFFHYSADVRSREPWCDILDGWDSPDELKLDSDNAREWQSVVPIGWRQFLREEAFKHFVVISDDDSDCERNGYDFDDRDSVSAGQNAAVAFDTALLELAPRQFGNNARRNYKWHSIVGMSENQDPLAPWPASEPVQSGTCNPGSEGPGTGFQALSVLTDGLRYPSCNNENFDAIFAALAEGVVLGSLACEWAIPSIEDFNPEEVNMRWVPSSGATEVIGHVDTAADCDTGQGWHYDDNDEPQSVVACPATCDLLQTDPDGRVDLVFGCETVSASGQVR